MSEIPEFVRRAIEAQGKTDADTVAALSASAVPTDEEALAQQRASGPVPLEIPAGIGCCGCGATVTPGKSTLYEVTGWCKDRKAGGQNHVIARAATGRVLCNECGLHVAHGLDPGQGALV